MKKILLLLFIIATLGAQDYSLQFDGVDDYVTVGTPDGMNSNDSHTFLVRVNYIQNSEESTGAMIFGEEPASAQTNMGLHYGFRGGDEKNKMAMDFYASTLFSEFI